MNANVTRHGHGPAEPLLLLSRAKLSPVFDLILVKIEQHARVNKSQYSANCEIIALFDTNSATKQLRLSFLNVIGKSKGKCIYIAHFL